MTSLKCAAKGGRIVTCGATTGPNPKEEIRLIFWKQLSILGSTMANDREFRAMLSAVGAGKLMPRIDSTFAFSRAVEAYERLEKGDHHGKVVLVPDSRRANGRMEMKPDRTLSSAIVSWRVLRSPAPSCDAFERRSRPVPRMLFDDAAVS